MFTKTDKNQIEITNTFRKLGYSVCDLSGVGRGCPDILIGKGNNYLIEIKNPNGKNKIGDKQKEFALKWNTPIYIVKTIEDVIKLHEELK